jgi:hypothetical protein
VRKSRWNLFVNLSPAVFAFALLTGPGCSRPVKPPTPTAIAAEPVLPKTPLHAADEPALPKTVPHAVEQPASPPPHSRTLAKEWYSPREADFRPEYDRDAANQARESWSEYWSWVKTFYQGNLFSPGWTAEGTASLQGVRSEKAREELRSDLNELGRRVAAEWSKDNGVRKIDTAALRVLGGRITKAAKRDDGSGRAIEEELQTIRAEVEARLSGR